MPIDPLNYHELSDLAGWRRGFSMTRPRRVVGPWATQSEEREALKAGGGGGFDSARSASERNGPLPGQAQLLRSLQSTAGNRAVTALVRQRRNESGAAGLPQGRSALIQRKVLVGGTWYGKKDEAALQALKVPENLPAWSDVQLREDAFYVLKPDRSGWDEDTTLLFYRFKNVGGKSTRPGYAKVGASGRDPFADVGFGKTGQDRVNPKHLDRRTVLKARLFKYKTEIAGHWMLECEVR